eukprot:199078_1
MITKKWYVANKRMDEGVCNNGFGYAMISKGNNVHLIKTGWTSVGWEQAAYHVKYSLYDLVPNDVVKIYQNYYTLLIYGYFKKYVKNVSIPKDVKNLIALLYPCFI